MSNITLNGSHIKLSALAGATGQLMQQYLMRTFRRGAKHYVDAAERVVHITDVGIFSVLVTDDTSSPATN